MIARYDKHGLQEILSNYLQNFHGLRKLEKYETKLHTNDQSKPIELPRRSIPCYLQEKVVQVISEMLRNDAIEEHHSNEPAPWISNNAVTPKTDGSLRVTPDAKNIKKAIQSRNLSLPRQEDI